MDNNKKRKRQEESEAPKELKKSQKLEKLEKLEKRKELKELKELEKLKERKERKDLKKGIYGLYVSSRRASSSPESDIKGLILPKKLYATNLPYDATRDEVKGLFNVRLRDVKLTYRYDETRETNVVDGAEISFDSAEQANEALKRRTLRGHTVYVEHQWSNRVVLSLRGLSMNTAVGTIKQQVRHAFKERGKVLNVFIPTNRKTGFSFGFGYLYLELRGGSSLANLCRQATHIAGVRIEVQYCLLKTIFEDELENRKSVLEEGSDEAKKSALKKVVPPLTYDLRTGEILSWIERRSDIIPPPHIQDENDCWAVTLHRAYYALLKRLNRTEPSFTLQELKDGGVSSDHLYFGGLDRMKSLIPFMKRFVKDMRIHHRPRIGKLKVFENFERFIIRLLDEKGPLMVRTESTPGFCSFDGQGVYRPSEIDMYASTFERHDHHWMLLLGCGIHDGIEYWEVLETAGDECGDNGVMKIERHKFLIKGVVEFDMD